MSRRGKKDVESPERPSGDNTCSIAAASDITAAALVRLISTTLSGSTSCSRGRKMHKHLVVRSEVAAHGGIVGPARLATVKRQRATPLSRPSERAASTIASARWRLFSSAGALEKFVTEAPQSAQ